MKNQLSILKSITLGVVFGIIGQTSSVKAAPNATSTANFSGTVAGSCTVTTPFPARTYTQTAGGPAGGRTRIGPSSSGADFNCNSDNISLTAVITNLTSPQFTNATNLDLRPTGVGIGSVHKLSINEEVAGTDYLTETEINTAGTVVFNGVSSSPTDGSGNTRIIVRSLFDISGGAEDLAAGAYSVSVLVTVTPQ